MLQGGRPGTHTLLTLFLVSSNAIMNVCLIPIMGIYGAAMATGFVYVLEAMLLIIYARKMFGVSL